MFKEAIQPTLVVNPTESSFYFPALTTVAFFSMILRWPTEWNADMIITIRNDWDDPASTQLAPQWLTVVPLIKSQTFRAQTTFTDLDAINGFEDLNLVMPMPFANGKVQRMTVSLDHDVPFDALQSVFSRISDFAVRPFLDLTRLAS